MLSRFRINLGFLVVVILSFVLGWQLGHRDYNIKWTNYKPEIKVTNQTPPSSNANIDFKLFWDTWNLVAQKYIDKKAIDPQKMYYGAIQGMVAAIGDPYTVFLPPESQKSSKEQLGGSFDGVGIQLGYNKDKRLVVVAPLKDTPAEKAGVKAGDLIVQINGKDSSSLSLPEAVSQIRGVKGTSVALSIFSEGDSKPRTVNLTRDTIVVRTVDYEAKTTPGGKKVAYLRLSGFGEKTRQEWDESMRDALADAPQGIIVDVRNNPGGYLEAAVYVASEFLDGGKVVMQEDSQGNRGEMDTVRSGKALKQPLVILINKGSASASEILAGAMQDRSRGSLVGEQSFGKGTIQSTEDLPQGTGIHITTAKWLTPDGRWIHNIGLTPDIKIEFKADPNNSKADNQLDKALEVLDSKI